MNPNNPTTQQFTDSRIREFAYQIWESEGKPEGHSERHWEMACKLAATQTAEPLDVSDTQTNVQEQHELVPSGDTDSSATKRISADNSLRSAIDHLDNKPEKKSDKKSEKKSKGKKKDIAEADEVQLMNIDGSEGKKPGKSKKKHKSSDSISA